MNKLFFSAEILWYMIVGLSLSVFYTLARSFSGYTRKLSQRVVLDGRRDIHIYQKQMYWMKTKNASCRTDSFYHFLLWLKKSSKVVDSSISCSASHPQKKQTISCMKFMTNSHSSGAQSSRSRCKVDARIVNVARRKDVEKVWSWMTAKNSPNETLFNQTNRIIY